MKNEDSCSLDYDILEVDIFNDRNNSDEIAMVDRFTGRPTRINEEYMVLREGRLSKRMP